VIARVSHRSSALPALLFLLLLAPPIRTALEASMTTQMLVQMPLLILVGVLLSRAMPARMTRVMAGWDCHGITGFLLATLVGAFWMLPRSLDAAVTDPLFAVAKYLTMPLLIGLPFALSWQRMGFILRGVFQLELIGLSTLGSGSLRILKDNIPGYQPLHDDSASAQVPRSP